MKKIVLFLSLIVAIMGLAACDKKTPTPEETEKFTVTFISEGVTYKTVEVESGKTLTLPSDPTKEGFSFDGWFTTEALVSEWEQAKLVTENITLYAGFTEIYVAPTTEELIQADLDAIVLSTDSNRVTLPKSGSINKSKITWTSNQPSIITKEGYVVNPPMGSPAVDVELTAKTVLDGVTVEQVFVVTVNPMDAVILSNESKALPFENLTSEYEVLDTTIDTYYSENGSIPYVEIESFLDKMNGLIYSEELKYSYNDNLLTISVDYYDEETLETTTYEIKLDFDLNTVYVETLDVFSSYVQSTSTDFSEGITYLDPYYEDPTGVTMDLNKYRFDLVIHSGEQGDMYMMPFSLANLLFVGQTYYNVYYNGDAYYGVYGTGFSNASEGEDAIAFDKIRSSSLAAKSMPYDLMLNTYDAQVFVLDYFYGLTANFGVESFYELTESYLDRFLTSKFTLSNAIFDIQTKLLDDLHTSYGFPGYYTNKAYSIDLTSLDQLGLRVRTWYQDALWEVQDSIEKRWVTEDKISNFRFLDLEKTTAVIYISGFETASSTEEKSPLNDTDAYMRKALDDIFLANPNVENIVVDLSYNTGGNLGALLRVLGYITEQPIQMSYQNPTDGSKVTYFAEIATDAYEEINWFFLTSGVTFSAANLMTAIGKHQGIATIIGTLSGGGASSITPILLPDGTFFTMSSLNVLSLRHDNGDGTYTYESIEYGIEPDYELLPADVQDDQKVFAKVQEALAEQK